MRPSHNRPPQQHRRVFDIEAADRLVAETAQEMIAYVATLYEHASEEDRLELILRYGPVLHTLQQTVSKAARAQQRRRAYPGKLETK